MKKKREDKVDLGEQKSVFPKVENVSKKKIVDRATGYESRD